MNSRMLRTPSRYLARTSPFHDLPGTSRGLHFILVLGFLLPFTLGGQAVNSTEKNNDIHVTSMVDWEQGVLHVDLTSRIKPETVNPASAVTILSRRMANNRASIVLQALMAIRVNSTSFVGDVAKKNPTLLRDLEVLANEAEAQPYILSPDLQEVTLPYTLSLFPRLSSLLVKHTNPIPLPRVLTQEPSPTYSGLVIYAGETLPVHGEYERGKQVNSLVEPALFLDLFDDDLSLIVDPNRTDPQFLIKWGAAAYTSSFDESPYLQRIGEHPLRIPASALFGIHDSDILLPNRAAQELLSNTANHRILREGRILVIAPRKNLQEVLSQ